MANMPRLGEPQVRDMIRAALAAGGAGSGALLHRLDAVLQVAGGRDCSAVASLYGVDRRTIERWVHAAYVDGMDSLAEHHGGGRPQVLSADQVTALQVLLRAPPTACGYCEARWSGKRLAAHLATTWGVQLSTRTCQRLIADSRQPAVGRRGFAGPDHRR